ncbi:MAG: right-handed parallel beta-helix repeat-containing protein, partial [Candidatus Hydrogenedentota bacterium]
MNQSEVERAILDNVRWNGETLPPRPWTPELVARRFGLDAELLLHVRNSRSLDIDQIMTMNVSKLARSLWRSTHPKPDHPGEAVAWRLLAARSEDGTIPRNGIVEAAAQAEQMRAEGPEVAGIDSSRWTWIGPGNIGGRIRSIVIHPTDPSQLWIGAVSGGIWKSNNAGASWSPQNDFMPNLNVTCMVIDSTNPSILYAGTGEGFYNVDGLQGFGIFKTTNGGTTWDQLSQTSPNIDSSFLYVNRLSMAPDNPQVLLAATQGGMYRTTNGGANWTITNGSEMLDVDFNPSDSRIVVSGTRSGVVMRSTNSGQTFSIVQGLTGAGRVEVAWAPSDRNVVYASLKDSTAPGDYSMFYRSNDSGQSFVYLPGGDSLLGAQGWYDNIIWVDPTDSQTVVVGGVELWRSRDGGASFTKISQWDQTPNSPHADQHMIVAHPGYNGTSNTTIYLGNDGGIVRANDIYTVTATSGWTYLNNNLGITQFYSGSAGPTGIIFGGTQDNGTLKYTGNALGWTTTFGGDGGFVAAHPNDENFIWGEYTNLQIFRSIDAGASAAYINNSLPANRITDADSGRALFIAPFVLDRVAFAEVIWAGGLSLWRTTGARSSPVAWYVAKNPPADTTNYITAIALTSDSNAVVGTGVSNVVYAAHMDGSIFKTHQAHLSDPTGSWTRLNDLGSWPIPGRMITRIVVDPNKPQRVYVTLGGFKSNNLWRSEDGGVTWTDVNATATIKLPSAPIRTLAVSPRNSDMLYAGTEIGIFASEDRGLNWSPVNDGPANVSVDELFWFTNDTLIAATHGRGMFKATIPKPGVGPNAWYVSPGGSDDGTGLNSGVPKASLLKVIDLLDDGDTIFLGAGTYSETELISGSRYLMNIRSQNIAIIGAGESTILDGLDSITTTAIAKFDNCTGIIIRNLTLKNAVNAVKATGSERAGITGCRVERTSSIAIHLDGGTNHTISDNILTRAQQGIKLENCTAATVSNNTADSIANLALHINSGRNHTVSGNNFSRNQQGMKIQNASNVSVTNNTTDSNELHGIELSTLDSVFVSGNRAHANPQSVGIMLVTSQNGTVYNNNTRGNGMYGLYFSNISSVTVDSNTVYNNSNIGISLTQSSGNRVTGNRIENHTSYGIELTDGSESNIIERNITRNSSQSYGIAAMSGSNRNFIRENELGWQSIGIYLSSSCTNSISQNGIYRSGTGLSIRDSAYGNEIHRNNVTLTVEPARDSGI